MDITSLTQYSSQNQDISFLSLLTREDVAGLIAESAHAFLGSQKDGATSASDLFDRFSRDPQFEIFGHRSGGDVVSYITILSYKNESHSRAIGPMYVSEAARGTGIGKRQVTSLIDYLEQKEDVTMLFTKTWESNVASKAIFESLGFRVYRVIENDRQNGDATIEYRRFK